MATPSARDELGTIREMCRTSRTIITIIMMMMMMMMMMITEDMLICGSSKLSKKVRLQQIVNQVHASKHSLKVPGVLVG